SNRTDCRKHCARESRQGRERSRAADCRWRAWLGSGRSEDHRPGMRRVCGRHPQMDVWAPRHRVRMGKARSLAENASGDPELLLDQRIVASTTPYRVSYARLACSVVNTPQEVDMALRAIRDLT